MNEHVELSDYFCQFSFSRSETMDIWGSCMYTLVDDLDDNFFVEVDNIEAFYDAGETELPVKLTEYEIDLLCEWIYEEANQRNMWEDFRDVDREWMDKDDAEYI